MKLGNIQWRIAALKNGFQDATAYRLEFLFEVLGAAFVPAAIQWVLWYALFKVGGATQIAGMTYEDMVAYTLVSILFTQVRGGDHDFELAEMIRGGGLSNYLLRPVGVVEFVYIRGVAPKIFIAGFCLVLGIAAMLLSKIFPSVAAATPNLTPLNLIYGMALAFFGNIIHYQVGATLATASFYWEEAYSLMMVKNMIVQLLSGELIPLNLFPESMQWIWKSTPFYLYVFGPTQIALGRWSTEEIWMQFGIAGLWMIGGWVLIRASWGLGIRRYLSLGG
ncbi:MAG: ABC-2 family transporter protein [Bdellovibrionales bacterium]|nr:ABC-2 family transporter protein [Bdellovibrionales bacterium]